MLVGELVVMDFSFFYDCWCDLLVIGYNVEECCFDVSFYDLFVFEVWLVSYVVIV